MVKLRAWDTSTISRSSLIVKIVLAGYVAVVWIWCFYSAIFIGNISDNDNDNGNNVNDSNVYVVVLEWNSVIINLFWLLSFVKEWKYF